MTPSEYAILNTLFIGLALLLFFIVMIPYRALQPKGYGLLFYALLLTLCACLTYGLYNDELQVLADSIASSSVTAKLASNLRILVFVVPGLMLGVAANLITAYLQAPKIK